MMDEFHNKSSNPNSIKIQIHVELSFKALIIHVTNLAKELHKYEYHEDCDHVNAQYKWFHLNSPEG
jgi:hypothetical protein